jgi:hypothetical protein
VANWVFVGKAETPPKWLGHGYEAALKLVDSRTPGVLENPTATGPFVHGWGVHDVADDHHAVLAAAKHECDRLGLRSYGLDIEFGWFYDGDALGWGPAHEAQEWDAYALEVELLTTARELFGAEFPLWATILPFKDYGPAVFTAANVTVVPQLYGARDPLPNAAAAWADSVRRYYATPVVPALWVDQPSPAPTCIRFLAEIMDDGAYL